MSRFQCGCVHADAKNTPAVRLGYEVGGYLKQACAQHAKAPEAAHETANAAHVYHAPVGFTEHEKSAWSIGYEEGRNAALAEGEETASELHEADKRIRRLSQALREIHGISQGSTTANSLQNLAQIASDALGY